MICYRRHITTEQAPGIWHASPRGKCMARPGKPFSCWCLHWFSAPHTVGVSFQGHVLCLFPYFHFENIKKSRFYGKLHQSSERFLRLWEKQGPKMAQFDRQGGKKLWNLPGSHKLATFGVQPEPSTAAHGTSGRRLCEYLVPRWRCSLVTCRWEPRRRSGVTKVHGNHGS